MSDKPNDRTQATKWWCNLFATPTDAVKISAGSLFGLAAVGYCFYAAGASETDRSVPSVLLCIFSLVVGWIMGIVMTPSTSGEETRFSEYGKALAAVASGFFAGQYKEIIALYKGSAQLTPISGLLAGCCFLIGLLFTFIFRSYVGGSDAELQAKRAKATVVAREAFERLAAVDRNDV